MRKYFFLILLGWPMFTMAQNNDDKLIRATISRLFEAKRQADTVQAKAVFLPRPVLMSNSQKGGTSTQEESIQNFIKAIGKQPVGTFDERLAKYRINTDGFMATAWIPYTVYLNGVKSHCGIHSITLLKIDPNWYILSIIDTRNTENCRDLPKP